MKEKDQEDSIDPKPTKMNGTFFQTVSMELQLDLKVKDCLLASPYVPAVTLEIPMARKIPNQNGHGQTQAIRFSEL